jgi:purine-nucleoside phosphorylase
MHTFENHLQRLEEAKNFIQSKLPTIPKTAIVLGSGLGEFVDQFENKITISYDQIPHFKKTKVEGHAGALIYGTIEKTPVLALQGRVHAYEGHDLLDVVFGVRTLGSLGVKNVILTNASGGINLNYKPGDLVLITDHLNLTGKNPLVGPNIDKLGTRFPDMGEAYNVELNEIILSSAKELNKVLHSGVYAGVMGPTYETPSEIKMFRILGADMVGMSTVPETIALHHMGVIF